jgi:type IV pilus assembly protein PilW
MKPAAMPSRATGFGLVELMLAMGLGLIVTAGVLVIFLAERQVYYSSSSQSLMQDTDNAISATITPAVRGAGFLGCGVIGTGVMSSVPARTTTLVFNTSSAIQGFTGTLPTSVVDNAANDVAPGDWDPELDETIVTAGGAEQGSDVLVMIGAAPNTTPIGVTAPILASPVAINDPTQLNAINGGGPQMVAVSDCSKSSAFEITGVAGDSAAYTTGPGTTPSYLGGAQLVPLQQTMYFVSHDTGGQSTLYQGVMTIKTAGAAPAWTVSPMVPGVTAMKVLYGIGNNEQATQYVDASKITNWSAVTTIKLAFVVEGALGSAPNLTWSFPLFNGLYTVKGPADTRMRHVFYMTINTRNATL